MPQPPGGAQNAWSGFEWEPYRVENLRGRHFSSNDREARIANFHDSKALPPSGRFQSIASLSFARPRVDPHASPAGMSIRGAMTVQYNILNGQASTSAPRPAIKSAEDSSKRASTSQTACTAAPRSATLTGPQQQQLPAATTTPYASLSFAQSPSYAARTAQPPHASAASPGSGAPSSYTSARPRDRVQQTSSGAIGAHHVEGSPFASATRSLFYPRVLCRETRRSEVLLVGPRSAAGHNGQGCP